MTPIKPQSIDPLTGLVLPTTRGAPTLLNRGEEEVISVPSNSIRWEKMGAWAHGASPDRIRDIVITELEALPTKAFCDFFCHFRVGFERAKKEASK